MWRLITRGSSGIGAFLAATGLRRLSYLLMYHWRSCSAPPMGYRLVILLNSADSSSPKSPISDLLKTPSRSDLRSMGPRIRLVGSSTRLRRWSGYGPSWASLYRMSWYFSFSITQSAFQETARLLPAAPQRGYNSGNYNRNSDSQKQDPKGAIGPKGSPV